jgi:hypothetical protein
MKPGVTTYLDGEQPLEALKVGLVSYLPYSRSALLPRRRCIIFRGLIFSDEYWIVLTYVRTVSCSRFFNGCLFCFFVLISLNQCP